LFEDERLFHEYPLRRRNLLQEPLILHIECALARSS
jgi:hypothetical protein